MKKLIPILVSVFLLSACGSPDDPVEIVLDPTGTNGATTVNIPDDSSLLGISFTEMTSKYGNPSITTDGTYRYSKVGKTSDNLVLEINVEKNQIYRVTRSLATGDYLAKDLQKFFSNKYTTYQTSTDSLGTFTYGNAASASEASVYVTLNGKTSVVSENPKNTPSTPTVDLSGLRPEEVPGKYLNMSNSEFLHAYGNNLIMSSSTTYRLAVQNNSLISKLLFAVNDSRVIQIEVVFNSTLTDSDIIAYYEALGYKAKELASSSETSKSYLFFNLDTYHSITYSNRTVTYVENKTM